MVRMLVCMCVDVWVFRVFIVYHATSICQFGLCLLCRLCQIGAASSVSKRVTSFVYTVKVFNDV